MKNMIKLPAIVLGLMLLLTGTAQRVMAQDEDISLQSFYDELSPYGTWIQDPQYGYVWRPDADQGEFRPYYTNGRWVMTEYGNTWVSNYDWGWAPFHYGRWVYNRYNQWVWIPDTVWGPAWVSWRSGGGYYGWAPMGPGMHINVNFNIPDLWWVFIPQRNIYYNSFPRYYSRRNVVIINNTTIINNTYSRNRRNYYTGPRADDIRRHTRQTVQVYDVNRVSRPGRSSVSGNRVDIYTPSRPARGSNANAAPKNVVRGEGYASPRPERGSSATDSRNSAERPSRDRNEGVISNRGNEGTTRGSESSRPSRNTQPRDNSTVSPERTGVRPGRTQTERTEQPQVMQSRPQRQEAQPERIQAAPQAPRPEARPQPQPQPQRAEQSRPAPQPQRQQPQPQPQRVEQSRPSRGSESRGNSGGGSRESSSSSRPTRGSRG